MDASSSTVGTVDEFNIEALLWFNFKDFTLDWEKKL